MTPGYKVLPQFRRPFPGTDTSYTELLTVGDGLFAVLGVAAVRKEVLMSVSGFTIYISRDALGGFVDGDV